MIFASETTTWIDYISRAGVVTLLIFVVYGGYKRWWVFGWQYRECQDRFDKMEEEKNAWRETALRGKEITVEAFDRLRRR